MLLCAPAVFCLAMASLVMFLALRKQASRELPYYQICSASDNETVRKELAKLLRRMDVRPSLEPLSAQSIAREHYVTLQKSFAALRVGYERLSLEKGALARLEESLDTYANLVLDPREFGNAAEWVARASKVIEEFDQAKQELLVGL